MDSHIKQEALKDAVKLAEAALGSGCGNVPPFFHGDECAEFVETVYHKLCELQEDATG